MKEFTSGFVAIPLPEELREIYQEITDEVKEAFPEVQLASREHPHITVLYLKKSSIGVPKVRQDLRGKLKMLQGGQIGFEGFGYFRAGKPRVLFLNVDYPFALEEYRDQVSKTLSVYTAPENNLRFHPHLTVGSVADWPEFDIDMVNSRIQRKRQSFGIWGLGIYGADSKQKPEYQELLETIE